MIHSIRELWDFRYLVWNLAQRDLRSRYKKSVLGWLWSLFNPASTLIIFTVVFGLLLGGTPPPAGNGHMNYGLYLFAGLVVWNFFNLVVTGSITALNTSGGLLKKVYFPPSAPAAGNLLVSMSQVLIEMGILAVFMILWGNFTPFMLLFPLVVALTGLFAMGIGLWASILNLFYRDIGYLVTIALNVWFYATPIVYPLTLSALSDPHAVPPARAAPVILGHVPADWLKLNPMTDLVEINRGLFYSHNLPGLWSLGYVLLATLGSLALGSYMFNRKAQYVSEEV